MVFYLVRGDDGALGALLGAPLGIALMIALFVFHPGAVGMGLRFALRVGNRHVIPLGLGASCLLVGSVAALGVFKGISDIWIAAVITAGIFDLGLSGVVYFSH